MRDEPGVDDEEVVVAQVLGGEQVRPAGGGQDDVDVAQLTEVVAEVERERVVASLPQQPVDAAADKAAGPDDRDRRVGGEERVGDADDAVGGGAGWAGGVDTQGVDVLGRVDEVDDLAQPRRWWAWTMTAATFESSLAAWMRSTSSPAFTVSGRARLSTWAPIAVNVRTFCWAETAEACIRAAHSSSAAGPGVNRKISTRVSRSAMRSRYGW
ncbi:hypothetical protein GCM10017691_20110 [Pseudonocardia petroleophila]|nr:hypothetical protein [Pseudonocardia petroleophila]